MRFNPAYCAAQELQHKSKFSGKPQFLQNESEALYCLIPLPAEITHIKLAGKSYRIDKAPHISIYQYYKQNEKHGLSVAHYTWYGVEENGSNIHIVLHAYFDHSGKYINCQIKNAESKKIIRGISPEEGNDIEKKAHTATQVILKDLLQHVYERRMKSDEQVNQYLNQLDTLSQHIKTQLPKYKLVAKSCLEAIDQKNLWTFGPPDSRAELLKTVISSTKEKFKTRKKKINKDFGFYPSANIPFPESDNGQDPVAREDLNNQVSKIDVKAPDVLTNELTLKKIESEILFNKKEQKKQPWEKSLIHLGLLNRKFSALVEVEANSFRENELIQTMQQINLQHKYLKSLFEENALNGDLDAIKHLSPFVTVIDILFLDKLLIKGNISVCQYVIQNFHECLLFINHFALSVSSKKDFFEKNTTLLNRVYAFHTSPELLDMLLKNGANPDFRGINPQCTLSLLELSIAGEKDNFVRVLLENGANPNQTSQVLTSNTMDPTLKNINDSSAIRRAMEKAQKQKPEFQVLNTSRPLAMAIALRNKKIINLLLQFGASVAQKDNMCFDVLGLESCSQNIQPDIDIIKLLLQFGADINAIQGKDSNVTTALIFACQRGDLDTVKNYIALGADPNLRVPNACRNITNTSNPVIYYDIITALGKSAFELHLEIVNYLLNQKLKPVTFLTVAITLTFNIKLPKEVINIDPVTLTCKMINNPNIEELHKYINSRFKSNAMHVGAQEAYQYAQESFKSKEYEQALTFFFVCLLFGKIENRHSVLYNIASCYKHNGETDKAITLFQICQGYAPGSPISGFAEKQLERMTPPATSLSMRFC